MFDRNEALAQDRDLMLGRFFEKPMFLHNSDRSHTDNEGMPIPNCAFSVRWETARERCREYGIDIFTAALVRSRDLISSTDR